VNDIVFVYGADDEQPHRISGEFGSSTEASSNVTESHDSTASVRETDLVSPAEYRTTVATGTVILTHTVRGAMLALTHTGFPVKRDEQPTVTLSPTGEHTPGFR